jgi:hypothetical protein
VERMEAELGTGLAAELLSPAESVLLGMKQRGRLGREQLLSSLSHNLNSKWNLSGKECSSRLGKELLRLDPSGLL